MKLIRAAYNARMENGLIYDEKIFRYFRRGLRLAFTIARVGRGGSSCTTRDGRADTLSAGAPRPAWQAFTDGQVSDHAQCHRFAGSSSTRFRAPDPTGPHPAGDKP